MMPLVDGLSLYYLTDINKTMRKSCCAHRLKQRSTERTKGTYGKYFNVRKPGKNNQTDHP
jgi:hypothetical protein